MTLAEWPRQHYGYRQRDVREILSFLDEVISDLRAAAGMTSFDVALVSMAPEIMLEPMATMPSSREQIDQVLRVASLTTRSSERVALLQTALLLLDEAGAVIGLGTRPCCVGLLKPAFGKSRPSTPSTQRWPTV